MDIRDIENAIRYSLEKVDVGLKTFSKSYPKSASVNGIYESNTNTDWTNGFWTGMLWLAYEFTKDDKYKESAMWQVGDFYNRIVNKIAVNLHDMGFLYTPSCVAAYKLTNDETAKNAAILAAENLCSRFQEKGQFIQAWGNLGAEDNYRLIIDCLLNIPLLFWAAEETGKECFRRIAEAHLNTTIDVIIRDDASTYHTYFFDTETGKPSRGKTHQGYSDDSIWARGQAWGVYGLALAYKHTQRPDLIDKFIRVTDVFLSHLPADNVPAWDLVFTDTETLKDSSASPIVVCGILEMSRMCELPSYFKEKANIMMKALCDNYLTTDIPDSNGILKHAVYSLPYNKGIDECNIWGDYFFMEALMRMKHPEWVSYWE